MLSDIAMVPVKSNLREHSLFFNELLSLGLFLDSFWSTSQDLFSSLNFSELAYTSLK